MPSEQHTRGQTSIENRHPDDAPLVSIILLCYCEAPHIRTAVASILNQQPPDGGFEVLVADGMSEDGTREILAQIVRSDRRIRVVDNPGRIASCGLNTAIRLARGQILIRMDAHTRYAPDYVRQCVSVLHSTGADNVGGPWTAEATGYLGEAIAAAFQSPFAVGGARGHKPHYEGEVDTVYLGCWRKDAFQRFGGFDEQLVRDQDDEHNLRIIRQGGRVWQSPTIRSWYSSRTSLGGLFRQYHQYGYWKVPVIRKHRRPAALRHLVPGLFLLILGLLCLASTLGLILSSLSPSTTALSSLGSFLLAPAAGALLGLLSLYVLAVLIASLHTAGRTQWKFLPVLPPVFCCYHFAYGCGFLRGVLDFAILKRSADVGMTRLTRENTAGKPPEQPWLANRSHS